MFQGLSLEQAPPYRIPLRFYMTGAFYLIVMSVMLAWYALALQSRFDYASIALTHALTIGFFTHIMFGSLFQMLPVMLGIAYKSVVRDANIIYVLLNAGVVLFVAGFLSGMTPLLHSGGAMLGIAFLYFGFLSFGTVFESVEKDYLVQNFAASFALLFVATIFGFIALLGHSGFVSSVKFGEIHIALMLFGWVFILINAVSYKIIPMFFVAKEFPSFMKQALFAVVLVLLFGFIYFRLADNFTALAFIKTALAACVILFALQSIWILKNRKRARRDISIDLWYFSMANAVVAAVLFSVSAWVDAELSFFIGFFALFGSIYALMNAMLYKIVPFLTWFHLSSSMVFDAEMSEVIKRSAMKRQLYFFYGAYISFLLGYFNGYFIVAGALLFAVSSFLLLLNIIHGYRYYNEYIKKAVDMSAMGMGVENGQS